MRPRPAGHPDDGLVLRIDPRDGTDHPILVHVLPEEPIDREHIYDSPACWCGPHVEVETERKGTIVRHRGAFTLVELMVVIVILGVLVALLLPVISGAMRTAKNAAVTAEFGVLGASLEAFRTQYGEYPPSRVMLCEDGHWNIADATMIPVVNGSDITYGALAQRSIAVLRKFWPQVPTSTAGPMFDGLKGTYFDFNGNGRPDAPTVAGRGVILDGAECLAFFLGGIPLNTGGTGTPELSLAGFAKGRTTYPDGRSLPNPFRNNIANGLASNIAYGKDRDKPGYEFRANRLSDLDGDGFPEYQDYLATGKPIAYFLAGAHGYDPNDVNMAEASVEGAPAAVVRKFRVGYPVIAGRSLSNTTAEAVSPAPNPYSSSLANTGATTAWHRQSSYQLLSPGADGFYGLGGQYAEGKPQPLPTEGGATNTNDPDPNLRAVEMDNLSNFSTGPLGQ